MSTREPAREIVERLLGTLLELQAEGVDYVGPRPPRSPPPAAGGHSREGPTARAPEKDPKTRRSGWQPRVAALRDARELSESDAAKAAELEAIRADLGECTRCELCQKRSHIVFGEGHPGAPVVFVGEGPGADEDRSGRPFVGRAGELLTRIIESVGWTREDVYICNIVKCRPPGNRNPHPEEVATCRPFLERQLSAIAPIAIVALGKPAAQTLLGRNVAITRERGIWASWNGIPVMPTFHPAYLLRNYTRDARQAVWDDLRAVRARVDQSREGADED